MRKVSFLFCLFFTLTIFSQDIIEFEKKAKGYFTDLQNEPLRDSIIQMMNFPITDSVAINKSKKLKRKVHSIWDRLVFREDGSADFTAYQKAYKSFLQSDLFCSQSSDNPEWELIGPTGNVEGYQNQGLVSAISVAPNNLNEIVIGTYGGIFKTTNGGTTWVNVTESLPYPSFAIQHIIRLDAAGQKMVAASGSDFIMSNGLGTLYSNDGGDTWAVSSGLEEAGAYPIVNFLSFDGVNVYAGTPYKIFKSTDNGQTWAVYQNAPTHILNPFHHFGDFKANSQGDILMGTQQKYANDNQLLYYNAATNQWSDVSNLITPPTRLISSRTDFPSVTQTSQFELYYLYPTTTSSGYDYPYSISASPYIGYGTNELIVRTAGWSKATPPYNNNIEVLSCDLSERINNKEIMTSFRFQISTSSLNEELSKMLLKYHVPRGVKLKIAALESKNMSSALEDTYQTIRNQANYDLLWSNVLYESDFATSDQLVDLELDIPNITFHTSGKKLCDTKLTSVVFILETNQDYTSGSFYLEQFNFKSDNFFSVKFSKTTNLLALSTYSGYHDYYEFDNTFQQFNLLYRNPNSSYLESSHRGYFILEKEPIGDNFFVGAVGLDHYDESVGGLMNIEPDISPLITTTWHCDVRSMQAITDPGDGKTYLFVGNDGGLSKAEIVPGTSYNWESLNGNLATSMYYNVAVNSKTGEISGGLQDNHFFFMDEQGNWEQIGDGDGINVYYDWQEDFRVFSNQSTFNRLPSTESKWSGMNSTDFFGFLDHPAKGYIMQSDRIYAGGKNGNLVRYERDNPKQIISATSGEISGIGLCESDRNVIYVATAFDDARLLRSIDGGVSFQSLSASPVATANGTKRLDQVVRPWYNRIRGIAVDDKNPNKLWITLTGMYSDENSSVLTHEREKVLMSIDGGNSFVDYSQGIPNLPVQTILYIDGYNDLLFLGTDAGAYYRDADMNQWECFSNGLPITTVTSFAYNYCSNELYCSTWGRGVYSVSLDNFEPDYAGAFREISTTTAYAGDEYCFQDIRIKNGAVLTVTGTLHMGANRTIHVEPGGRLVVDGGTITNSCGSRWQGIHVYGQSDLRQSYEHQGALITRNNAVIEFANQAVELWNKDSWNETGGIIIAENTTFRNNGKSVVFFPYQNIQPSGNEVRNISRLRGCSFIVDDTYVGNPPFDQVTMFRVNGVTIQKCHFEDQRTSVMLENRLRGIRTLDASFRVLGECPVGQPCDIHNFDEQYVTPTTFKNLSVGIHAQNAQTLSNAMIDRCHFDNVTTGVVVDAADNALVTRNLFETGNAGGVDITTEVATAYKIEGNTFRRTDVNTFNFGTQLFHSGPESNEIFRNQYENTLVANWAIGVNRELNSPSASLNKGLQFLCNTYTNNYVDQHAAAQSIEISGEGIQDWQGSTNFSAGNTFDHTGYKSIVNTGENQSQFRYFYDPFNPDELPINSSEINIESSEPNECLSSFQTIVISSSSPLLAVSRAQLWDTLGGVSGKLLSGQRILDSLQRLGDTSILYTEIANVTKNNSGAVFNQLQSYAPYLSEDLLYLLADVNPVDFPHEYLRDICILHPEISQKSEFIKHLTHKAVPMPQIMVDSILNSPEFSELTERRVQIRQLQGVKENYSTLLLQDNLSDSLYPPFDTIQDVIKYRGHLIEPLEILQGAIWSGNRSASLLALSNAKSWLKNADLHPVYEIIASDFIDLQQELLNRTNGTYLEGLSDSTAQVLRDYAETALGYAKFQAENYLCYFLDECSISYQTYSSPKSMSTDPQGNDESTQGNEIVSENGTISLYPNPASDEITLRLDKRVENLTYVVYNTQGQVLKSGKLHDVEQHTIPVGDLRAGNYMIRLRMDGQANQTLRFVVQ